MKRLFALAASNTIIRHSALNLTFFLSYLVRSFGHIIIEYLYINLIILIILLRIYNFKLHYSTSGFFNGCGSVLERVKHYRYLLF